jgi:hypothetical protein
MSLRSSGGVKLAIAVSGVSGLEEAAVLEIAGGADIPFAPSVGFPQGPS